MDSSTMRATVSLAAELRYTICFVPAHGRTTVRPLGTGRMSTTPDSRHLLGLIIGYASQSWPTRGAARTPPPRLPGRALPVGAL